MRIDLSLDEATDTKAFRSVHGWSQHPRDHKGADRTALDRVAVSSVPHDEIELYEMLIGEVVKAVRRSQLRRIPLEATVKLA